MLEIRTFSPDEPRFLAIVARGADINEEIGGAVAAILTDIRLNGVEALLKYIRRFDSPLADADAIRVTPEELREAASRVEPEFLGAIRQAVDNVRTFHRPQLKKDYELQEADGVTLAKRVLPISRVGVYCPAGTAPLFSSLIMNAVPAQLAGVGEIAVAIPPRKDGSLCPYMLATAHYLGLEEIHRMGGAQAIAALAFGAGPVRRVDKIVGPGNAYVATAKRQVYGMVGVDSVAGPSEIVVIADHAANPRYIAADLLSQLEHGSGYESGVVLTDDPGLARRTAEETNRMIANLSRADSIRRGLSRYGGIFVCPDLASAADAANLIAPEHLEIQTENPRALLPRIVNAGAVFLGPWSSEPVGDYFAGTNHVLPTTGAARFSSSLGVADFQRDMSVIDYSAAALRRNGGHIMLMAEKEGLTAHANAIRERMRDLG
ncbi:MAG: histidinol dehydrogenase [Planctomycetota bacterium]|jgi:histidinol dehydrogenase|nr:histidinol dehydrogenase [Planctomycetota bacterium]